MQNWHIKGKLSEKGRQSYDNQRNKVEKKLHRINIKIESREPTWWENIKDALIGFIALVMTNIPGLGGWLLGTTAKTIAKLPAPVGWLTGHVATTINSSFNKHRRLNHEEI